MKHVQYTVRDISPQLDRKLRKLAAERKISLNRLSRDALEHYAKTKANHKNDLARFAGTWQPDPAFDAAIKQARQIDTELWQ